MESHLDDQWSKDAHMIICCHMVMSYEMAHLLGICIDKYPACLLQFIVMNK